MHLKFFTTRTLLALSTVSMSLEIPDSAGAGASINRYDSDHIYKGCSVAGAYCAASPAEQDSQSPLTLYDFHGIPDGVLTVSQNGQIYVWELSQALSTPYDSPRIPDGVLTVSQNGQSYVWEPSQALSRKREHSEINTDPTPEVVDFLTKELSELEAEIHRSSKSIEHLTQPEQSGTLEQQKHLEQPETPEAQTPLEHPEKHEDQEQLEQSQQPVKATSESDQVVTKLYNEQSTSLSVMDSTKQVAPDKHWGKCGHQNGWHCTEGQCCSQAGWCGVGADFCSVPHNCQSHYGRCINETWPAGFNTWEDKRTKVIKEGSLLCKRQGSLALTFDDGPTEHHTTDLLNLLKKENAKASFFVSGISGSRGQLDITPTRAHAIKRMFKEGHYIGSHGFSHAHYNELSTIARKSDLVRNEIMIRNLISASPTYMRLPYQQCNGQCSTDIHALGYHIVGTGYDSGDWRTDFNLEKAKKAFDTWFKTIRKTDSIVISQHDSSRESAVDLTRHILKEAKKKGLTAVTFPQCRDEQTRDGYRFSFKTDILGETPKGKHGAPLPVVEVIKQRAAAGTTKAQLWLVVGMAGLMMLV